jgi:hypothetical protein
MEVCTSSATSWPRRRCRPTPLDERAKSRALQELKQRGLIELERRKRKAPVVTVIA